MSVEDIKVYTLNLFAFSMTFSSADAFLKFLLTAIAIGYTANKWYFMHQDRKEGKRKQNDEEN